MAPGPPFSNGIVPPTNLATGGGLGGAVFPVHSILLGESLSHIPRAIIWGRFRARDTLFLEAFAIYRLNGSNPFKEAILRQRRNAPSPILSTKKEYWQPCSLLPHIPR